MTIAANTTLLIVDDDEGIRETLGAVLPAYGCRVTTAAGGVEALEWLRSGQDHPCLILADLMMPGMNGFEFYAQLTHDPALVGIPVVFITGAGRLIDEKAADLKAEVLRKPFELDTLLTTIERFCAPVGPCQ
jgi:CheY-like chemotaxis protein